MSESFLERARYLLEVRRYPEAEKEIRHALAQDPQDDYAHALLALTLLAQDRKKEAIEPAQQAVGLDPNSVFNLFVLGRTWFANDQNAKAREVTHEALKLDPTAAHLHLLLSQIEYDESRWELALHSADKGLEFDPEDQDLINMRTMALVKLDRTEEAAATVDYGLYNEPESSHTHANKGWVDIHAGRYESALASFKEALRLNPNSDYARSGLKESIKAKNWLYRGLLRYFLWMGKLSSQNQWAFIIGAYMLFRGVNYLADRYPAFSPYLMPIIYLYIIFALSTWFARPLSNLALRLHPLGKFALTDDEVAGSNWSGLFLAAALVMLLLGFGMSASPFVMLGVSCGLMLIPIGGTYNAQPGSNGRKILALASFVLFCLGIVLPLLAIIRDDVATWNMGINGFGIGIFLFSIIGPMVANKS